VWLGKKIQNLPTRCTSCRLNAHNQLGRLCVYGIYKRTWRAPTRENALVLVAVDIGGKNTQEQDQVRTWAAAITGPEISTVSEGILGRWGGLWLPARERTLTAVTKKKKKKNYSHIFICPVDSFEFFPLPAPTPHIFPLCLVVNFIGTMKSN